jgi:protein SCO1
MKRIFLLCVALLASGYSNLSAQTYTARGLVLKIDKPHRSLLISCEEIPNVMEAMVMPFSVRNPQEIDQLSVGAMIEFTLVADGQTSYIQGIHVRQYQGQQQDPLTAQRLKLMSGILDAAATPKELKNGEHVPNFTLIDQAGHNVTLSQFSGKIVVLTFTYTRCVLPNFCFRNSNNLRWLQKRFEDRMGRDLILMTVTFDPVHDTPEVMAQSAKTWSAVPGRWEFLTGESTEISTLAGRFGMTYWPDEGLMNHSLHTAIIDRRGKLVANLEGNEYTADELGDLVRSVLDQPSGEKRPAGTL